MRYLLVATLVVSSLATAAMAQDDSAQVRVGAFNLQNAFDVFDDPFTLDETMRPKPRAELKAAAAAIAALDADVLGVVEVENEHVLRAMIAEFLPDSGYEHAVVLPTNSDRGIHLGVISRLPIVRVATYRYQTLQLPEEEHPRTWSFARALFQVTVDVPGDEHLELFVVHLKSKHDSDGDPNSNRWRLAEATEMAGIVGDLVRDDPRALVAMVGDFNDTPGSAPIEALLAAGLQDAHASLSAEQRVTYLREPYRSTIDYVLVSPALAATLVPGSATVGAGEARDVGSDHAPVAATFDLGD